MDIFCLRNININTVHIIYNINNDSNNNNSDDNKFSTQLSPTPKSRSGFIS